MDRKDRGCLIYKVIHSQSEFLFDWQRVDNILVYLSLCLLLPFHFISCPRFCGFRAHDESGYFSANHGNKRYLLRSERFEFCIAGIPVAESFAVHLSFLVVWLLKMGRV
jgi:hypothetical protein